MTLELSRELQRALDDAPGGMLYLVDPRNNQSFVLLRYENFEQLGPQSEQAPHPGSTEPTSSTPTGMHYSKIAFLRDLPALLKQPKLRGRWVAYHGAKRLGFGTSETSLYQNCFRRGLTLQDCYVGLIRPHPSEPETLDPSLFEFSEEPPLSQDKSSP